VHLLKYQGANFGKSSLDELPQRRTYLAPAIKNHFARCAYATVGPYNVFPIMRFIVTR
jgi:hypothetical protein